MSDVNKTIVKASLGNIRRSVEAMGSLSQELAERLEKAERFIRKMGYCPWCEKRLPKKGYYDPKACRHDPRAEGP